MWSLVDDGSDAGTQADARQQSLARGDGLLWQHLLADLRRRLELRAFESYFPGELALVEEYQVSRATVHQALRMLREEGVLVAARGRAPRLAGPVEIAQRIGSIYSLFESVQARGVQQRSVVCPLDVRRNGLVATRLDLGPESVPRDRVVVAVCRSGNRSGTAAILPAAAGVDVRNMAGGMTAWAEAGLPITTGDGAPGTVG